jgi:hypothetical protein
MRFHFQPLSSTFNHFRRRSFHRVSPFHLLRSTVRFHSQPLSTTTFTSQLLPLSRPLQVTFKYFPRYLQSQFQFFLSQFQLSSIKVLSTVQVSSLFQGTFKLQLSTSNFPPSTFQATSSHFQLFFNLPSESVSTFKSVSTICHLGTFHCSSFQSLSRHSFLYGNNSARSPQKSGHNAKHQPSPARRGRRRR